MGTIDFVARCIGYTLMLAGGLALFAFLLEIPVNYVFRQMRAYESFGRFVIARHRGTWPPAPQGAEVKDE